jgi:hypothetical protein
MPEKLPDWLSSILPDPEIPVLLQFDNHQYLSVYPDGVIEKFSNVETAYKSIKKSGFTVKFDNSLPELTYPGGGIITLPNGSSCISITSDTRKRLLEESYSGWFNGSGKRYSEGDTSFIGSYDFLDGHPCFWTRREDRDSIDKYPYEWKTNGHVNKFWFEIDRSEDRPNGIVFMMECGAHAVPDYTHHYRDFRFDVWADSFEDAVIQTAALIHKFFNLDGSDRENVEYEKSELELDIESSIEDFKASQQENEVNL